MYLSVIVPAYNEERRLPKTLREIDKYLRAKTYDYEIIVVSDGSKDRTVEVVRNLMAEIKNLKILDFKENQGKGFGVRQGMLEAKGDFRLFTDADNSTSVDQVEKMWPEFKKGYDIVIGSRDVKGAVLDPPQSWLHGFLADIFKLLRKIIAGLWELEDTQCGFKCFTKKAAESIFPKCKINRFAFDPEFLIVAKKLRYKIKEIPIYWKNDPESKVKFKSMVKMGIDLLKIRWNLITEKYDETKVSSTASF
ncbi:MAG: dolichyl-phosphate beta-glucosyltransferase [Candidatus Nealsonbacteria bacterium]